MTKETRHLGMQQPSGYRICVEGWVPDRWRDWFHEMAITLEGGEDTPATSTLQGVIADQAALLGLLQNLYNLGLPLLMVERDENLPARSASQAGDL